MIVRNIAKLSPARFTSSNPRWIKDALMQYSMMDDHSTDIFFTKTGFARNYEILDLFAQKFLSKMDGDKRAPLKVLDIGVGGRPFPEVFEIANLFVRRNIKYQLTVVDMLRKSLKHLIKVTRITMDKKLFSLSMIGPSSYCHSFLGKKPFYDDTDIILSVPKKLRNKIKRFEGNIITDRLPDERFDMIFCFNVLTWMDSSRIQELALRNMARGLVKGGYLITDGHYFKPNNELNAKLRLRWEDGSRYSEFGMERVDEVFDAASTSQCNMHQILHKKG